MLEEKIDELETANSASAEENVSSSDKNAKEVEQLKARVAKDECLRRLPVFPVAQFLLQMVR